MKRLFTSILVGILVTTALYAQDTTWVNTLNFNDIVKRNGTYVFPTGKTYRKINMHYTLKCDPRTAQDNFDCGEWDYLSYVMVLDSTGVIDSTSVNHSNFQIGVHAPDNYVYSLAPTYDTFYRYKIVRTPTSVTSADSFLIGLGGTSSTQVLGRSRSQFLYTANELINAGFSAGDFTSIGLLVDQPGLLKNVEVRLMPTGVNSLPTLMANNGDLFYHGDLDLKLGKNRINGSMNYSWDGVSNILIELTYDQSHSTIPSLEFDVLPSLGVTGTEDDLYYELDTNGFMELKDAQTVFSSLDKEVTVSLWTKGGDVLPQKTSVFEGRNNAGQRALHAHLPWENEGVYFDAGQESGYDRLSKTATSDQYKNNWNHWVFVKNATTETMKIYLNGVLWHSANKRYRGFPDIESFRLGRGFNAFQYSGKIDRLTIWKSELNAAQIDSLYKYDVTTSHPKFADLICSFSFDNYTAGSPEVASDFNPNIVGVLKGRARIAPYGREAFFKSEPTNNRPVMEFVSANQTTRLDSSLEFDLVARPMEVVAHFNDATIPNKLTGYEVTYRAGYSYSYNPDGTVKDSSMIAGSQTLNKSERAYMQYSERVNNIEIARYITPYGIGMDLGPDGFKWIYDVTDYAGLLEGNVTLEAGNQQELIDLRFELIEGTPVRDLKEISYYINRNSKRYDAIAADNVFTNEKMPLHPDAKTFKMVTRITGHGHNTSSSSLPHCCEWADKKHYLKINGRDALEWDIWQDDKCALNPLYDQGGNWAPPRAGWCPGAPVDDYNFDITEYINTTDSVAFDYDIEPVPLSNTGQGGGNYVVSMHLMQYGDYKFGNDASVEQIIRPNNWEYYLKLNPTCGEPKVRVRNTGGNTITEVGIKYGVVGGNPVRYYHRDTIKSDEAVEIDLPFAVWDYVSPSGSNKFYAEIFSVNKSEDENPENDRAEAQYDIPKMAPKTFTVFYRNNDIEDATLQIFDDKGKVVYEQLNAPARQLIREDVTLNPGCYKLVCETENGFGLTYPLIPQIGSGLLLLTANGTSFREDFNEDFGKRLEYYFTVGYSLPVEEVEAEQWSVHPNPTNGRIVLSNSTNVDGGYFSVQVLDLTGKTVLEKHGEHLDGMIEVNLENQMNGAYFIKLIEHNKQSTFKVLLNK